MAATDYQYQSVGDQHVFSWPEYGFTIHVEQTHRTVHGLYGEIRVATSQALTDGGTSGHLLLDTLNLSKNEEKAKLVKSISALTNGNGEGVPWERMLEAIRVQVRETIEVGRPLVRLAAKPVAPPRDLFAGVSPMHETTTFYGDGSSGKSYLMVASAIAAATGMDIGPFRPTIQTNVLVLDGETGEDEWRYRISRVCAGLRIEPPSNILYREIAIPIVQDQVSLRRMIAGEEIGYAIIDSILPALGSDVTAETVPAFFNALRTLGKCSRSLVSHVTKATANDERGIGDPFGSVFVVNLSRSVWALRRDDTSSGSDVDVSMVHRKVNRGRLQQSRGLRIHFVDEPADGPVTLKGFDLMGNKVLSAHTRLADQLYHEMKGGPIDVKTGAEVTGAGEPTIYKTLERMVQRGDAVRFGGGRGRGKAGSYALAAFDDPR